MHSIRLPNTEPCRCNERVSTSAPKASSLVETSVPIALRICESASSKAAENTAVLASEMASSSHWYRLLCIAQAKVSAHAEIVAATEVKAKWNRQYHT